MNIAFNLSHEFNLKLFLCLQLVPFWLSLVIGPIGVLPDHRIDAAPSKDSFQ